MGPFALALVTVLAAALCAALAAAPARARTLVFCSEGNPETLDPARATTTTSMNATWQIYDGLVAFAPGTTEIRPGLAESWTVSEDGRSYLFTLRADVAFHANARFAPSRPMNAEDVVFSFARQWRPDHPFHESGRFGYFRDLGLAETIVAIEAVGARQVRFGLREPDATFLANIAQAFGGILSAEYAATLAQTGARDALATEPIGTGPFAFAGYQPDHALRFRRFRDHWGRPAAETAEAAETADALVFSITPNAAVRLTKLRAGECHVMAFPAIGDLDAIRGDPDLRLFALAELNVAYLALNTARPPFDDVRVRRAMNLAIDRRAIVQGVYGPAGIVASGPLPPGMWAHDSRPDPAFDRAEALRLLAGAGLPDGFETDLWYLPVSRPYNPNGRRAADMIQADLAQVGIRARLATQPWNAYRAALYAGEPATMLYGWTSDNGDPDNILSVLLGCPAARPGGANLARWCDRDYEALIQEARRTEDRAARTDLYRRAQAIVREQAPWVPLAHTIVHMAARRDVANFRMDPLGRYLFDAVRIEQPSP